MTDITNDNDTRWLARSEGPDAHGEAAILLVESLIHTLVAQSVIKGADAIDVVNVAFDVRTEMAANEGKDANVDDQALMLLSAIRKSLGVDFPA